MGGLSDDRTLRLWLAIYRHRHCAVHDLRSEIVSSFHTLRHWLWENFGFDLYEWEDDDVRF